MVHESTPGMDNPRVQAEYVAAQVTPKVGQPSIELTEANVTEVWLKAIRQLEGMAADPARVFSRVLLPEPDRILVVFQPKRGFNKTICEQPNNLAEIENAVTGVVGRRVRVSFGLADGFATPYEISPAQVAPEASLKPIGTFVFGGNPLQVYGTPEEPWFLNNEVCRILGHTNPRKAASTLDPDETTVSPIVTPSRGVQQATFVNESGLYSLVMKSRLPSAKPFQKWVTSEVLPSVRKHGAYVTPKTQEEFLNDPDAMIHVLTNMKKEREARVIAEEKAETERDHRLLAEADREVMAPAAREDKQASTSTGLGGRSTETSSMAESDEQPKGAQQAKPTQSASTEPAAAGHCHSTGEPSASLEVQPASPSDPADDHPDSPPGVPQSPGGSQPGQSGIYGISLLRSGDGRQRLQGGLCSRQASLAGDRARNGGVAGASGSHGQGRTWIGTATSGRPGVIL